MKRIVSALILLFLLAPCALSEGFGVMELYDEGMESFYMQDYAEAAACFRKAGNYSDAKKWAYYCEALQLVMNSKCGSKQWIEAEARITLLEAQSFRDTDQWALYIKGKEYEASGYKSEAAGYYGKILIHDSLERYLTCVGKPQLLKTRSESLKNLEKNLDADLFMSAQELYQEGMDAYYFEEYAMAADYFAAAGNYMDAGRWCCFTQAISLILEDDNLSDANALFRLLQGIGFEKADDWLTYIKGREFEKEGYYPNALGCYSSIMIYDSSERYVDLYTRINN